MPKPLIVAAGIMLIAACAAPAATPTSTPPATLSPTAPVATPTATPSLTPTASPSPTATATTSASPTATTTVAPTLAPTTAPAGWTEATDFPAYGPTTHITGIAYGDGVFTAVGWSERNGNPRGRVWTSPNGRAWTAQTDTAFAGLEFDAVTYSGSGFYAFAGAPTTVWKSADGVTWQQVELPESGGELGTFNAFTGGVVLDATSAGGQIYAAGESTVTGGDIACSCVTAWRSSNGTDWNPSVALEDDSFNAFAALPDMALVIAHGTYIGQALRASTDFDSWSAPDIDVAEGSGYLDAAASDDRIVAVGYWGDEYDVPISLVWDGTLWSGASFDETAGWPADLVTSVGGRFIAVGGGLSWTSSDGLAWLPGPAISNMPSHTPPDMTGDDPFLHRSIGSGDPGVVVADTGDDGLQVWFAPVEAFALGL